MPRLRAGSAGGLRAGSAGAGWRAAGWEGSRGLQPAGPSPLQLGLHHCPHLHHVGPQFNHAAIVHVTGTLRH